MRRHVTLASFLLFATTHCGSTTGDAASSGPGAGPPPSEPPAPAATKLRIATGDNTSYAVLPNGGVAQWGSITGSAAVAKPSLVAPLDAVVDVSGSRIACALRTDRTVHCWGADAGALVLSAAPRALPGAIDVVELATGTAHVCVRTAGGTVRCGGRNASGQLGNGQFHESTTSVADVAGVSDAIAVAAGSMSSCAITSKNELLCWGELSGSTTPRTIPGLESSIAEIAVGGAEGDARACARTTQGDVRCLVQGSVQTVDGAKGALQVAVGARHACALLPGGELRCWGANAKGQLGDGSTKDSDVPVVVALPGKVHTLTRNLGAAHTCAILDNGEARCWGDGAAGQLGDGQTAPGPRVASPML